MSRRSGLTTLVVVMVLVAAGCGDDSASTTSTAPATTAATTSTAATTTTQAPAQFTATDLPMAVLADGDPWAIPVTGVTVFELTLDDIWPIEEFPEERQGYVDAGFEAGSFGFFGEADGVLITGAHLFEDADGADAALDLIQASFSDTELVAAITDLPPGSLTDFDLLDVTLGDRAVGVILTGPEVQVVGIIWVTGNLLQFVRAGMSLGDDERAEASFDVAEAMAARTAG